MSVLEFNGSMPKYNSLDLYYDDIMSPNVYQKSSDTKLRRTKLNMSEDEKILRRKFLNRISAQQARERKKQKLEHLEQSILSTRSENKYLKSVNSTLMKRCSSLQRQIQLLEKQIYSSSNDTTKKSSRSFCGEIEPSESAAESHGGSLVTDDPPIVDDLLACKQECQLSPSALFDCAPHEYNSSVQNLPVVKSVDYGNESLDVKVELDAMDYISVEHSYSQKVSYERIHDFIIDTESECDSKSTISAPFPSSLADVLECIARDVPCQYSTDHNYYSSELINNNSSSLGSPNFSQSSDSDFFDWLSEI